jgi:hypothetical protein
MMKVSAKRYFIFLMLVYLGLLIACAGCDDGTNGETKKSEFEIDKKFERGPLTVHVRVDKAEITIAETFNLELQATIEPDYEVSMPKVDAVLENFGIVDWDNLGDRLDPNNNVIRGYRYRLEPFLSGKYQIPALTFEFFDINSPEEKKYELTTEPIDIEVTSLLGEQREELKIADIEGVVAIPKETSFRWLWIPVVVIIVVAAAGYLFYQKHRRAEELIRIFNPAHEIAYERLRVLVAEDLVGAGRLKEFYERISDILRHYIEHRFNLRAPERTTEEFLIDLANTNVLNNSDKEDIGEFLKHCDLVKFAKYNPTTEEVQRTFDLVKGFIEKTKSDERKVDITDSIGSEQSVEVGSA